MSIRPLYSTLRRRFLFHLLPAVATAGLMLPATAAAEEGSSEDKHLLLIAGRPSHGHLLHEHNAGMLLFQECLKEFPGLKVTVVQNGWPEDESVLEGIDALVVYADGGGGHPAIQGDRLDTLQALAAEGVGIGMIHFAVEVPAEPAGPVFRDLIGGHYEHAWSVNPIWEAEFKELPDHPITNGVEPFTFRDEWYFNMRFRPEMEGVTPILVAKPSDDTRDGPYVHPRGPYPHIQEAKGRDEVLMWTVEREDGGRGFGFTGGHFHEGWGEDNMRKVVLNALVWVTGLEVPAEGVESEVDEELLYSNLDPS